MVERCLSKPGQRCVYGAPTKDQVREIAEPSLLQILSTAPPELQPKPRGLSYRFYNPAWNDPELFSTLTLAGVEHKRGDRLRGAFADIVCLDEVRDMNHLRYMVEEVIGPQFVGREDPLFIMLTTPPRTSDHSWVTYFRPRALETNRYVEVPGSKNPDLGEADKRMLKNLYGSEDSIAWKREVECQTITDPEDLIVPEFQVEKDHLIVPVEVHKGRLFDTAKADWFEKPKYYYPYVVMDTGYDPDFTAILWMYVNFEEQQLWVVDEVFRRRMTLRDIQKAVYAGNHRNWGKTPPHRPRHIADVEKRGLADLAEGKYKLYFMPVKKEKYSKWAGVAHLRAMVRDRRLRITSNCIRLIDQLENGIWAADSKGKLKQDFLRTETNGHWDAGAALVYGAKMINLREIPNPGWKNTWSNQLLPCEPTENERILQRALGRGLDR